MTKQEDAELRKALRELGVYDDGSYSSITDEGVDAVINFIKALIRTEKLKLLDEVIHQSTVNLKSAKAVAGWAELRKEQLEAEL